MATKDNKKATDDEKNKITVEAAKEPAMMGVKDINCTVRYPERFHDIYVEEETFTYKMVRNKHTEMLYEHACQFAQHDGFEVIDEKGKVFKPLRELRDQMGEITNQLDPDEVVANLEELTNDALADRANAMGGSFARTHAKVKIIDFIANENLKRRAKGSDEREFEV